MCAVAGTALSGGANGATDFHLKECVCMCVCVCVCVCVWGGAGKWRCRFQGVRSLGKGLWWLLCVKSSSEKKKRRTKKKRHAIASSNKNCSPVVRSRAAGAPTVASLKKVLGIGQLLRAGRR